MLKFLKKSLKIFLWFLAIVIVLANGYILLSGRTYIYTAVSKTYLKGQKGPGIYDQDYFDQRELKHDPNVFHFTEHPLIKKGLLTEKQTERMARNESTSLLIIKNDTIIYENYWLNHTKETTSNSFSMAKSLVSLLIGCAIEEGKIKSLDDSIGDYIPEFEDTEHKNITIRHLLSMSSGLDWHESKGNPLSHNAEAYFGSNLNELMLSIKVEKQPGETFEYKSGNTQVLAMILQNVLDESISAYASKKIWSKIGTEKNAIWNLDHENGNEKAYCCLYATTRDFAKIGKLMIQDGRFDDEQIVSSGFIHTITSPADLKEESGKPNDRYGLHWWLYPGERNPVYYARGILGQYIICIPKEKIIIVRTGNKREPLYEIPENEKIPSFMEQLEGHPQDLRLYTKLAFLLDSQINFAKNQ